MNLCTNADYAMRQGGGVLYVSLSNVTLDFEATVKYPDLRPGSYLKLTVSDTGHGMPPEVLERIFDPYFTTKEKGVGTGLGLAVIHGIVSNMNGAISVDSQPGRGAAFSVFMPLTEVKDTLESRVVEAVPMGNERILFVDDEEFIADLGQRMLERLGYDVIVRTSSIEALKAFKAQPDKFDLIITDMTMPQMTGEKLAQKLLEIRPDIPIILCTGFSALISENKAKEMGIKGFVMKPFVIQDLAKMIRRVLEE
jgi:CheY-like chemotaxis protein